MSTDNHIELRVSVPAPLGSLICLLVDSQDDKAFWEIFEAACRSAADDLKRRIKEELENEGITFSAGFPGEMRVLANLAYRLAMDDEQEALR